MRKILDDAGLDLIFRAARTHRAWQEAEVSDVLLQAVYDLAKMGPTSLNCCPMRVVFLRSPEAKARLEPALSKGNVEKTMAAPVTAIIAFDLAFHEQLPVLAPHGDFRKLFAGKEDHIAETAMRNGSLQGGYFIVAARALGLDCGPMSGFDADKVNAEFFADSTYRVNFLCNLGYGDKGALKDRQPRLSFDDACSIV
ncbi:MAG TPA: malonic semialdehyde reductase [Kiloniellaceae bacterium]|nr:malonic semialdehyde reductase [Kiloniellaceae bacterium]